MAQNSPFFHLLQFRSYVSGPQAGHRSRSGEDPRNSGAQNSAGGGRAPGGGADSAPSGLAAPRFWPLGEARPATPSPSAEPTPEAARVLPTRSSEPGWRPLPQAGAPAALTRPQQTAEPAWDARWLRMKRTPGSVLWKHYRTVATCQGGRHARRVPASLRVPPEGARGVTWTAGGRRARPEEMTSRGAPGGALERGGCAPPRSPWGLRFQFCQSVTGRTGAREDEEAGLVRNGAGAARQRPRPRRGTRALSVQRWRRTRLASEFSLCPFQTNAGPNG